jgi:hypothetical protein
MKNMKKVLLLAVLCFTMVSYGQSKKEQRIIDRTNEFVSSVEQNLPDVTKEEKAKFFEIKKSQIEAFWDAGSQYEKGTEEHKAKVNEIVKNFRENMISEFGKKRGIAIIKASLANNKG